MLPDYDKIDSLLREKGISRKRLAECIGISQNTLSAAFRRKSKKTFSAESIIRIADLLGVGFYDIISDKEPIRPNDFNYSSLLSDTHEMFIGQALSLEAGAEDIINNILKTKDVSFRMSVDTMLLLFTKLNSEGQKVAIDALSLLVKIPDFQEELSNNTPISKKGEG